MGRPPWAAAAARGECECPTISAKSLRGETQTLGVRRTTSTGDVGGVVVWTVDLAGAPRGVSEPPGQAPPVMNGEQSGDCDLGVVLKGASQPSYLL